MLTAREINILKKIINNENLELNNLSEIFMISKRMLHYDIKNINFYLLKYNFSEIKIKNGVIFHNSIEQLKEFIEIIENNSYLDKEDRELIIYLYSIFNKNGLNIEKMTRLLNISRNTVKSYMNNLEFNNFVFIHSKGYFLNIETDKKIDILIKIIEKKSIRTIASNVLDFELLNTIKTFIFDISKYIKLNLNEQMHQKILLYMYCVFHFNLEDTTKQFSIGDDLVIIQKIYNKYFENYNQFNTISDIIIGISLSPNLQSWLDESFLIKKLIKNISREIEIDLTNDSILHDFLLSHLKASIYRLKKNINLNNLVYQKLIWINDPILQIIKKQMHEIENIYNITFTDNELALIGYHFKASIERTQFQKTKKVILVCGQGYGTSRVLENDLKQKFNVDIVDVIPAYMINESIIKNNNVDYVLSTVDLDIECIKLNPLLKTSDYEKLLSLGFKIKEDKISVDEFIMELESFGKFNKSDLKKFLLNKYSSILISTTKSNNFLTNALDKKRVIFKDSISNWNEAIYLLSDNLNSLGSVGKDYGDKIIEMINKLGNYILIEDKVAIPHAKTDCVSKTDYSILILKKPVNLNGKDINVFFEFSTVDDKSHISVLNEFCNLILKEDFIERLIKINSYNEFINYLTEE